MTRLEITLTTPIISLLRDLNRHGLEFLDVVQCREDPSRFYVVFSGDADRSNDFIKQFHGNRDQVPHGHEGGDRPL